MSNEHLESGPRPARMRTQLVAFLAFALVVTGCSGVGSSAADDSLPEGPVLAKTDPCSLLTTKEASQFGMSAGKRKDRSGTRTCRYKGDRLAIENSLVEGEGVGKLADDDDSELPVNYDSVRPLTIAGKSGQLVTAGSACIFSVLVGQTSRVDFAVSGAIEVEPKQTCPIARKVAQAGVPRVSVK